jgi:uncharacterized protein
MGRSQTFTAIPRFLIRLYQQITFGAPRRCRFYPTCSDYTLQALEKKGLLKGLGLGLMRILRCHPFHPGGYHPISF